MPGLFPAIKSRWEKCDDTKIAVSSQTVTWITWLHWYAFIFSSKTEFGFNAREAAADTSLPKKHKMMSDNKVWNSPGVRATSLQRPCLIKSPSYIAVMLHGNAATKQWLYRDDARKQNGARWRVNTAWETQDVHGNLPIGYPFLPDIRPAYQKLLTASKHRRGICTWC